MPCCLGSIQQACFSGWFGPKTSTLFILLPSLILWELWCNRNRALFYSKASPASVLIANIKKEAECILKADSLHFHSEAAWYNPGARSIRLGRRKQCVIRVVRWIKPSFGIVKLNSDGAFRGNPGLSAGGGLIRHSTGRIIHAYASFYGNTTNMVAESRALHQGVKWLHSHQFFGAIVEVNSKVLVDCLSGRAKPPWRCWYFICSILQLQQDMSFQFQHCFREAIKVADALANWGCDQALDFEFLDIRSLPSHIPGSALLDIQDVPSIRVH